MPRPRWFAVLLLSLFPGVDARGVTAADIGQWQTLPYLMTINPIHVSVMHTGRVLIVAGSENDPNEHNAGEYRAAVWDPSAGTITIQNVLWDLFCNGYTLLPDGRAFVIGGTDQYDPFYGDARATIFDPLTQKFNEVESMANGRWYATGITLGDGRVLAFSGLDGTNNTNNTVEIYQVGTGWSAAQPAPWTPPLYPWLHVLPNGKVFASGSQPNSHLYDPATNTWTLNVAHTVYGQTRTYGSSVLLPLRASEGYKPRVMIMGGHDPATATAEMIDLSVASPRWKNLPPMSVPRIEMNAVLLPDGTVLAQGGSSVNENSSTASLQADRFDPVNATWSAAGVASYARLYHSVALLLPDATVWTAGSNPQRGTYEQHMEIYTPPYLFALDGSGNAVPAVRPTISDAPAVIGYGGSFTIQTPDAARAGSIALMRPGSDTHAWDMDQRMIKLAFSQGAQGSLVVTGPPGSNVAPPGYYMLFLLDNSNVPSIARFVQVSPTPSNHPPAGTITSPSNDVTIAAGSSVPFAGTASDPDGGPLDYAWIFPDGNPINSSAQDPGAVTFDDVGTYVASLTSLDSSGANDPSPPTLTVTVVPEPSFGQSLGALTVLVAMLGWHRRRMEVCNKPMTANREVARRDHDRRSQTGLRQDEQEDRAANGGTNGAVQPLTRTKTLDRPAVAVNPHVGEPVLTCAGQRRQQAWPSRPLFNDWLPARDFPSWPGAKRSRREVGDTTAVEPERQTSRAERRN